MSWFNDDEYCEEVDKLLKKYYNKRYYDVKEILEIYFKRSYSSIKQRYKQYSMKTIFVTYEEIRLEYVLDQLKKSCCFEVMHNLGFKYEANFTRWFRKFKNITPSEYKKRLNV